MYFRKAEETDAELLNLFMEDLVHAKGNLKKIREKVQRIHGMEQYYLCLACEGDEILGTAMGILCEDICEECERFLVIEKLGQPLEKAYKTLVTVGKSKNYFVFVLPVAKELDFKKCAKAVGEKSVEMIQVKDINKITGYIRGGCTAIGMKKNYVTVVDSSAKDLETMIVSGGRIGSQIELKPEDLVKVTNGSFADLLAD